MCSAALSTIVRSRTIPSTESSEGRIAGRPGAGAARLRRDSLDGRALTDTRRCLGQAEGLVARTLAAWTCGCKKPGEHFRPAESRGGAPAPTPVPGRGYGVGMK